jgi:hypothetical protein
MEYWNLFSMDFNQMKNGIPQKSMENKIWPNFRGSGQVLIIPVNDLLEYTCKFTSSPVKLCT